MEQANRLKYSPLSGYQGERSRGTMASQAISGLDGVLSQGQIATAKDKAIELIKASGGDKLAISSFEDSLRKGGSERVGISAEELGVGILNALTDMSSVLEATSVDLEKNKELLRENGVALGDWAITDIAIQYERYNDMLKGVVDAGAPQALNDKLNDLTAVLEEKNRQLESIPNTVEYNLKNAPVRSAGYAIGGSVNGIGSGDKVPALLEPGEFVLNRNAVAAAGVNKLSHFNKKYSRFKKGGPVKMQAGGAAYSGIGIDMSLMESVVQKFGSFIDIFANSVNSMNGLAITLNATHKVEVVINGAQILQQLEPGIQNLVITETNKAINNMLDKKFNPGPMD
jgi:hypothetical protein